MDEMTSHDDELNTPDEAKPHLNYWLFKGSSHNHLWRDLIRSRGPYSWTGVRHSPSRNNLRWMKDGDRVLIYHAGKEKAIVGIAEVVGEPYTDPTSTAEWWLAIDVRPITALSFPVTLTDMRRHAGLWKLSVMKRGRSSVISLTKEEYEMIVAFGTHRSKDRSGV